MKGIKFLFYRLGAVFFFVCLPLMAWFSYELYMDGSFAFSVYLLIGFLFFIYLGRASWRLSSEFES